MNRIQSNQISANERAVVEVLLDSEGCSMADLQLRLGVTATAVRQRLTPLVAKGLVDRVAAVASGRGRPGHQYRLTDSGRRLLGNNLADIAGALWQEIQLIPDESIRKSVIAGAVDRLANRYASQIDGDTFEQKVESIARLFNQRDIPVSIESRDGKPTLKILACPYPDLANDNREVCQMERELLAKATGEPMDLCQCRIDGDACCTFQQAESG